MPECPNGYQVGLRECLKDLNCDTYDSDHVNSPANGKLAIQRPPGQEGDFPGRSNSLNSSVCPPPILFLYGGIAKLMMKTGRPLRADIRAAGHKVWKLVCAKSREILGDAGDAGDAADVLEASVRAVSCYLEKINITLNSADPSGLLVLTEYRS